MSRAKEETLGAIHEALADHFTEVLKRPDDLDAATINQIRQFLKDNHIDTAPGKSKKLANLATVLPFSADDAAA